MTKRKSSDEQLWLLVGDDGTFQTVKKDRHEDEEEENVEFVERQGDDDEDGDDDDDSEDDDEDDDDQDEGEGNGVQVIDLNTEEQQEPVHNEVYIDQSEIMEEQEHDEINDAEVSGNGPTDSRLDSSSNNVAEEGNEAATASVKWTDKATFQLLDLIEKLVDKDAGTPPKNDRVWLRIAMDMKPFHYTADDCHKKFKYLTRTYRSVLDRKANNIPCNWRYFNRMCVVSGNKIPKKRSSASVRPVSIPVPVEPKIEPSTSADLQPIEDDDDDDDDDDQDDSDLSRFDQLLKKKKEILVEIKNQGEILQRHVEECITSTFRREERENDMLKLLMDLKNQEQKKLDLFRKLLDKLW